VYCSCFGSLDQVGVFSATVEDRNGTSCVGGTSLSRATTSRDYLGDYPPGNFDTESRRRAGEIKPNPVLNLLLPRVTTGKVLQLLRCANSVWLKSFGHWLGGNECQKYVSILCSATARKGNDLYQESRHCTRCISRLRTTFWARRGPSGIPS
jgi:hypothetical protein